MNVKHYPLRMWAMAGKVVVLDEVHAYDAYTGSLLRSLVEWLGALGSTVVILSATLPATRRRELLAAYGDGAKSPAVRSIEGLVAAEYPRLSVLDGTSCRVTPIKDDRPVRRVSIEQMALAERPQELAQVLVEEVSDGGCVGVVCNTVNLAQERYRAIAAAAAPGTRVLLLHSRLRPVERADVENELLNALSADAECRPGRMIVVATQIIEQSLDIDFDLLVTDIAPIDLLVQRAGRLHRHERGLDVLRDEPRLVVIDSEGTSPTRKAADAIERIYAAKILCRTRIVLSDRSHFVEPDDLDELVDFVYESGRLPASFTDEERSAYDEARVQLERDIGIDEGTARHWTLLDPHGEDRVWDDAEPAGYARSPFSPVGYRKAPNTRAISGLQVDLVVLTADEGELLIAPLTAATIDQFADRSITISSPTLAKKLMDAKSCSPPDGWAGVVNLRDKYLLTIDETGKAKGVDDALAFDPELGMRMV